MPASLRAVSGSPTLNECCGSSVCGRFRYSDLKEAALRGGLCIFYRTAGVFWVAGLVFRAAWLGCDHGLCGYAWS